MTVTPPFFDHPGYVGASAALAREAIALTQPDHVALSFHGVPRWIDALHTLAGETAATGASG